MTWTTEVDTKPTRLGYGEGLVELGKKNPNVVVLGADITMSTNAGMFQEAYPDRFFSIGIAEQDMVGVAAGLALVGKVPFVCTYGVFASGRCWDQIRTTVCYSELNVKIGGAHGGISVGPDGATHQALEEISIMRCLPGMTVITPCDVLETRKATVAAGEMYGPAYIRFGREAVPIITKEDTPFKIGKAEVFRKGSDVTVIACGVMVHEAIETAEKLAKEGISVRVVNLHTTKPIDVETIVKAAEETGAIVCAEEHQIYGGMGGAVCEVLGQHCPVPVELVAVKDRFGESGQPFELMVEFGLTHDEIYHAIKNVLKRKKG
ncbi:MAG: transketolase family protein [Cyanobacteriota bacterium]